jgi:hypothetical protein
MYNIFEHQLKVRKKGKKAKVNLHRVFWKVDQERAAKGRGALDGEVDHRVSPQSQLESEPSPRALRR